jgi:hypothetical protein
LDPPEKKTQVRRVFEYDFENMISSDWEELNLCSDRLDVLNEAYGIGKKGFPTDLDMNVAACKALFQDIEQNKEFWFLELFHPLECHHDQFHSGSFLKCIPRRRSMTNLCLF